MHKPETHKQIENTLKELEERYQATAKMTSRDILLAMVNESIDEIPRQRQMRRSIASMVSTALVDCKKCESGITALNEMVQQELELRLEKLNEVKRWLMGDAAKPEEFPDINELVNL